MRDVRETMFDCIEFKKKNQKKIHKEIKYLSIMTGL